MALGFGGSDPGTTRVWLRRSVSQSILLSASTPTSESPIANHQTSSFCGAFDATSITDKVVRGSGDLATSYAYLGCRPLVTCCAKDRGPNSRATEWAASCAISLHLS